MLPLQCIHVCLTIFITYMLVAVAEPGALPPRTQYAGLIKQDYKEELGLYNNTDKVKILTDANFKKEVLLSNHSILVEFYNSYCGHCKRFAPHYKKIAEQLYGWRDIIPIAAIDCAEDENNDLCRFYEVMAYPTLRYFGPSYTPTGGDYGKSLNISNIEGIGSVLAQLLVEEKRREDMISWPDFQPVTGNIRHLNSMGKYTVIIYEPPNSTLAIETILHLSRWPDVQVRRTLDPKTLKINDTRYNLIIMGPTNEPLATYLISQNTSEAYVNSIKRVLNTQHITEKRSFDENVMMTPPNASNEKEQMENEVQLQEVIKVVKSNKHMVYQADLERAIRTILFNEIPKSPNVTGEKLLALQRFLAVLNRYNPLNSNGQKFIASLNDYVVQQGEQVMGEQFKKEMKHYEQLYQPVFMSNRYVGCVGSKPMLRGFTCSLWQLFHYLTVQAAQQDKSQDPLEVLQAIHGYVKYFFGCADCSEHFQEMASKRNIWNTASKDEAILWLWAAHNEVNQRLAGDDTEDPVFPKIQFPSSASCEQCYRDHTASAANIDSKWNKTNVLQFLKNIHNPSYISRYGMDNMNVAQSDVGKLRQKRMISKIFNDVDIRMGMLLYGFCIVMLVLAFKLFALKGGYRKKPYCHDVLGKV